MTPLEQQKLNELLELCSIKFPNYKRELVEKAYRYSLVAHANKKRASGEPYFWHPYAVARILCEELTFDEYCVVGGLLHDTIEENSEITSESIREEFGEQVQIIVDGVTKIEKDFEKLNIAIGENYKKFFNYVSQDLRVLFVKIADRLHNMRELQWLKPEKRKRIATETKEIFAPLANRFGLGRIKWELEDLAFKEINRHAYDEIKKKINAKRTERENYLEGFKKPIEDKLAEADLKYDLSGRPKHLYSIYRKMIKQNKPFEEIYDLFAVRIILDTPNVNDCYMAFGIVNSLYTPVADRFKDYIAIPKSNGYQSLHTTVVGLDGLMVEVQIRTKNMHEIAEKGVAAHWGYKEGKQHIEDAAVAYISSIRELLENSSPEDIQSNVVDGLKMDSNFEEVHIFTPTGDVKRLPIGATPVDFAFNVHSKVGYHCIGAKVNAKVVPLDYQLKRSDQVEILTSKNQTPNKNWLKFVVTPKAKLEIRKFLRKEEDLLAVTGKESLEKKYKKLKLPYTNQDLIKLALTNKYDNVRQFYIAIAQGKVDLDLVLNPPKPVEEKPKEQALKFEKFADFARGHSGDLVIDGVNTKLMFTYSKCCNPIPGDPVAGYITIGEGIKIHRKNCKNLIEISKKEPEKIISLAWPNSETSVFIGALRIQGEDQAGLLNEIANSIVTYKNTSIKSINFDTGDGWFEGTVTVYVNDLDHLSRLIERLKRIKGIHSITRLVSN